MEIMLKLRLFEPEVYRSVFVAALVRSSLKQRHSAKLKHLEKLKRQLSFNLFPTIPGLTIDHNHVS